MKLNEIFKSNGLLKAHIEGYEERSGQLEMAELVEMAIDKNLSAVIEGPTGIGKGFAYLIPIILAGKTAIVSTSNKSLQDQLSKKDLPVLKKLLGDKVTWAVLKGKNNYFCREHFQMNMPEIQNYYKYKEGMTAIEAKLEIKKIAKWADKTKEGDVEHCPVDMPKAVKDMIVCSSSTKHEEDSPFYNLCFAIRSRERAKEVDILLVNHTLLALDISLKLKTEGKARILPDSDMIVIDEAHTFERSAVLAFSDEISYFSLRHLLNWRLVQKNVDRKILKGLSTAFLASLKTFLPDKGKSDYYEQKRLLKVSKFDDTILLLNRLITQMSSKSIGKDELIKIKVQEIINEAKNLVSRIEALGEENENVLKWSEARDINDVPLIKIKSVPLDISGILTEALFRNRVVIMTSATLAVGDSFEFFDYQMGVPEDALHLVVDTPFDFKKNTLIYISNGQYEKTYEIEQLVSYSKGNAFILFTSYKDMNYCYETVETKYPKLVQEYGVSRAILLEKFRETPNAVLFATRSFWEGIDVKGDDLVLVVIHKLPFETPSDLVYSSKTEKIDKELGQGKSWFNYTLPDTCLKLKQGVGRLIRSKTDKGVIAILDSRISYKGYGKVVVKSLPPSYITQKLEKVKNFYAKINGKKR